MKKKKIEEEKFFTSKKYDEFICDFEDKWSQFASVEQKVTAYFGNVENGLMLFKRWKNSEDLFESQRAKAFPNPYRFE